MANAYVLQQSIIARVTEIDWRAFLSGAGYNIRVLIYRNVRDALILKDSPEHLANTSEAADDDPFLGG